MSDPIYSEWICFHDMLANGNRSIFERFVASLGEGRIGLQWVNRKCADVESDEYNPLGSRGRFVAKEIPADVATPSDVHERPNFEVAYQDMFDDFFSWRKECFPKLKPL